MYSMKSDIHSLLGLNKELSTYSVPVFEKNLGDVWGVANMDRTIYINKDLSNKNKREAAQHEAMHVLQMRQGKVSYDNKNIYWRETPMSGIQKIARSSIKEGKRSLPWEKEIYDKTKTYAK